MYDEQSHQLFIQAHLDDLLNIISETTGRSRKSPVSSFSALLDSNSNESAQPAMLNMDAITALSYIFEGTLHDNLRKIIPLHQIIQSASIQHEIGVVKNARDAAESKALVPFKNLSNLIRRSLIANPFQVGQTMKRGTLLPLPFNSRRRGGKEVGD